MAQRPYTGRVKSEFVSTLEVQGGTYTGTVEEWGTFFVVSPSHVVTNWHVVSGYLEAVEDDQEDATIQLIFSAGEIATDIEILGTQKILDLAVIQVNTPMPEGVHRIAIGKELEAERLTVTGYAGGQTYTEGIATSFEQIDFTPYFNFPGVYKQGQSGGPIIDEKGVLVGVLWGSDWPEAELGYGTRVDGVRWILEKYAPEVLKLKGN